MEEGWLPSHSIKLRQDKAKYHITYHFYTNDFKEAESLVMGFNQIPKLEKTSQSLIVDTREKT